MKAITRMFYFYALRMKKIPVIAVSSVLAELLDRRFKIKADVVSNGVDFTKFYPDIDKEFLNKKGAKSAVVVFARPDYRKGTDIALAVLKNLSDMGSGTDVIVWAIGGSLGGIPGIGVENFGFVDEDVLRKILSAADVLLLPSRHEGLSLLALQALACACPILATAALDILEDNKDAMVSPIDDVNGLTQKLVSLLEGAALRDSLRQEGMRKVKGYSLVRSKEKFETALSGLKNRYA